MDTSFFNGGPITWATFVAFALFLVSVLKGVDWLIERLNKRQVAAVSPLTIDMAAVKIQVASQADALNAFKVEVARTYVTGDVITRLEGRIDGMVSSVRQEMQTTRAELLEALLGRPPNRR